MTKFLSAILLLIVPVLSKSQPLISFDTLVSGLNQPVDVEEVNDNSHRLFIVEQPGTIRIWNGLSLLPSPFLNVSSIISAGGERGLLSLAFHPEYSTNGYFFIYYTNLSGDITVARYSRFNADSADAASGVVLINIPKNYANHNGGNLVFGQDNYLYFGTGDGGSGGDPDNNSQNGGSLLGKMLRIDVNRSTAPYYNIPADNPFAGSTTTRQEIIATGLRNPWRWSFDKQTGDMWIADVGQNLWEEVNVVPAANRLDRNYGWSCFEGTHVFKPNCPAQPNNVSPIFEYPHNNTFGGYSITGGYIYRGAEFPFLQGYYLFTDYVTGNIWLTKSNGNGGWTTTLQNNVVNSISSFGETADGTLYATTLTGTIYKVIASSTLPIHLVSFSGVKEGNKFAINWSVQNEEAGDQYIVEKRNDISEAFAGFTRIKATENRAVNQFTVKVPLPEKLTYYRLKIISANQQISYSNIISVEGNVPQLLKAYTDGNNIRFTFPAGTTSILIYDVEGKLMVSQKISLSATRANISLGKLEKGIVVVRALINNEWQSIKVLYAPNF